MASAFSRGPFFRWFFIVLSEFHLPEHTFPLQLLLEDAQGLVNIVVPDLNQHLVPLFLRGGVRIMHLKCALYQPDHDPSTTQLTAISECSDHLVQIPREFGVLAPLPAIGDELATPRW